jgi:acylphosphatase
MDVQFICMNIRIEGEVQGVGFRAFAVREATARGIRGWVRNLSDGTVEALAFGPQNEVEYFITACVKGPRGARVAAFNLQPATPPEQPGFFQMPDATV